MEQQIRLVVGAILIALCFFTMIVSLLMILQVRPHQHILRFLKYVVSRSTKGKESNPVVVAMVEERMKSSLRGITIAGVFLWCFIFYSGLSGTLMPYGILVIILLLLIIAAISVRMALLVYRVEKGYYATNEYEARELIRFILDHSKDPNFSNNDGLKQFNPERELETVRNNTTKAGAII